MRPGRVSSSWKRLPTRSPLENPVHAQKVAFTILMRPCASVARYPQGACSNRSAKSPETADVSLVDKGADRFDGLFRSTQVRTVPRRLHDDATADRHLRVHELTDADRCDDVLAAL